jgi:hypothetical protein
VNHRGERDSRQVGAHKAALKLKELTEADIALGKWSPGKEEASQDPVPTVDEYFATFNRTYLRTAVRDSTQISYAGSFKNHISPVIGGIRMDRLSRTKVKEFVGSLVAKGLAKASIRIITAELAAVFNSAIEDGIVSENPAKRLTKFYKQAPVVHEEIQPLTREEVPLFLDTREPAIARALSALSLCDSYGPAIGRARRPEVGRCRLQREVPERPKQRGAWSRSQYQDRQEAPG